LSSEQDEWELHLQTPIFLHLDSVQNTITSSGSMTDKIPKSNLEPLKDSCSIDAAGNLLRKLPFGVKLRPSVTIPDARGTVCEIFSQLWDFSDEPVPYAYQVSIRPGQIKGWVVHRLQADRIFHSRGVTKWVLFDDRTDSPTYRMLSEIFLSEENRALMYIPAGVYHAVQNIGNQDSYFVNLPSLPYNHSDPDKYRLPLNTELIPYKFKPLHA